MKCRNCGIEGEALHKHHIVPKSLGGKDDDTNLIDLCIKCHGLAHSSKWDGRNGVVQKGIQKSRDRNSVGNSWLKKEGNEKILDDSLNDLYEEDRDSYDIIIGLMGKDRIDGYTFMCIGLKIPVKIKANFTLFDNHEISL